MKGLRYKSLFVSLLTLVSCIAFPFTAHAASLHIQNPILEISDKNKEIRFGITETKIYMVISDTYRDYANQQFQEKYRRDIDSFTDSNGSFIVSEAAYLETNTIEFDLDEIESVQFEDGKLHFIYRSRSEIGFEEILSLNGLNTLNSFAAEDLELFANTFKNHS